MKPSDLQADMDRLPAKSTFVVDEEKQIKIRQMLSEESAILAETFLKRMWEEEGINVPRVHRREGSVLVMDYLPGKASTARPNREMILTIAALQTRLHAVQWPDLDRVECIENYRSYLRQYLTAYAKLGLLTDQEQKSIHRKLEATIPWQMHPALIHDDLWGGNVLYHEGDVYLIDFASVKFLSLESDLLNSARYFQAPLTRRFFGFYRTRCRYVNSYADGGTLMQEVVHSLTNNRPFFVAFNLLRKGANMLARIPSDEQGGRKKMIFAMNRLKEARKILKA